VREKPLRTLGRITSAKEFNDLVITTRNGTPIRVRDVGDAEDGTKEVRSIARLNGVPTVIVEVRPSLARTPWPDRGGKEKIDPSRAAPRRREARNPPRPVALHLRGAARDHEAFLAGSSLSLVVLCSCATGRATIIAAVAIPTSV